MSWIKISPTTQARGLSVLRWLAIVCAFFFGAFSGRIAALVSGQPPCGQMGVTHPQAMVVAPDVSNPVMWGLASGMSFGAIPDRGFAAPQACLTVDAGRGFAQEAFLYLRMDAAKTWTWARGFGFALASWLSLWALGWLFRAARLGWGKWRETGADSTTSRKTPPDRPA
jgi:hypothetical protein